MKRFWLVLLSLGMVLAFSASAMAVDVKFSGDFTIGGMYLDKTSLQANSSQGMEMHYNNHHMTTWDLGTIAYEKAHTFYHLNGGLNAYTQHGYPSTGTVPVSAGGVASGVAMYHPTYTPGRIVYSKKSYAQALGSSYGAFATSGTMTNNPEHAKVGHDDGPSTAFFWQRLRLRTDFVVAPGLSFVTRADIMSRVWGGKRSTNMTNEPLQGSSILTRPSSTFESENIIFDWAYISYTSPIGLFNVGYMNDNAWGTVFGDSSTPAPAIQYVLPVGQAVLLAKWSKGDDNSIHRGSGSADERYQHTDYEQNQYVLAGIYNVKAGSVGLLAKYIRSSDIWPAYPTSTAMTSYYNDFGKQDGVLLKAWVLAPYAKLKFGPVTVQTEINWINGKVEKVTNSKWSQYSHKHNNMKYHDISSSDPAVGTHGVGNLGAGPDQMDKDTEINAVSGWLDVVADFNSFYFGATYAYVSGDDMDTANKNEGIFVNGGNDWNPCLIMWNFDRTYWAGSIFGNNGSGQNGPMGGNQTGTNNPGASFVQARVGVRPTPAWDVMASISYAVAAERPASGVFIVNDDDVHLGLSSMKVSQAPWLHKDYGYEIDLTATYKITNNLSYMLGAGYMFTGDYYKGISEENRVQDNYMVINKLTLTF